MILFCDTETTGLDERTGHLLEVALILTNDDLKEIATVDIVVSPGPDGGALTPAMVDQILPDAFVREMHEKSGLVADLLAGKCTSVKNAERHLGEWCLSKMDADNWKQTPLAGSTIGFDRRWLRQHMPVLEKSVSYRSIDVSTLDLLAARWAPEIRERRPKNTVKAHRALADARESIGFLRYFRERGLFAGGVK